MRVRQTTTCRADLMAATGQFSCPPAGSFVAVSGQFLVAAVTPVGRACRDHSAPRLVEPVETTPPPGWSRLSRPLRPPVGRACRDHVEGRLTPRVTRAAR